MPINWELFIRDYTNFYQMLTTLFVYGMKFTKTLNLLAVAAV